MEQALFCLQIEVLVVKKHLKHKRLEISENILFAYIIYLFIHILDITITNPNIMLKYMSPLKKIKFTTLLSLRSYFCANTYFNFGFCYFTLGNLSSIFQGKSQPYVSQ